MHNGGARLTVGGDELFLDWEDVDNAALEADANGDGAVDFNDLVQLAQNYNVTDGQRTWGEGDFTGEPVERPAVDVGHDEIERAVRRPPAVEHADDVRVVEPDQDRALPVEPGGTVADDPNDLRKITVALRGRFQTLLASGCC